MSWIKRLLSITALSSATMLVPLAGTAWAQPSNDSFADAFAISGLPFSYTEDTTQATLGPEDSAAANACGSMPVGTNSVWFAYTPTSDQRLKVDVAGSSYTVSGVVVTGTPSSFSPVSCTVNDATFPVAAGTTYYIDVWDATRYGGSGGTLSLSLTELLPPDVALTVNPSGTFNSKSGTATVSGTVSCSLGADADAIYGGLDQAVGRFTVKGSWSPVYPIVCDGTAQDWSSVVTPENGLFKGGPATVHVSWFACYGSYEPCASVIFAQTIRLKH